MEPLSNILGRRDYREPPEVQIIKQFMQENFGASAEVTIQERQIVIGVKGAALAGSLRLRLHELTRACETDKRLVIRIQS